MSETKSTNRLSANKKNMHNRMHTAYNNTNGYKPVTRKYPTRSLSMVSIRFVVLCGEAIATNVVDVRLRASVLLIAVT